MTACGKLSEFTHNPFITLRVINITTTPAAATKLNKKEGEKTDYQLKNRGVNFTVARGVNFRLSFRNRRRTPTAADLLLLATDPHRPTLTFWPPDPLDIARGKWPAKKMSIAAR